MKKKTKTEAKPLKFKPFVFDRKKFAKDILSKREAEDLSFRDFTKETGVSWSVLYGFEAQRNAPNAETFGVIVAWLGTNPSDYYSVKK